MNELSIEHYSLIKDRCTTCGSLLPCALHDREMKRGMLSEGEERWPELKVEWRHEYGENGDSELSQVVSLPDGSFIYSCLDNETDLFFVQRLEMMTDGKLVKRSFVKGTFENIGKLIAHEIGIFEIGLNSIRLLDPSSLEMRRNAMISKSIREVKLVARTKTGMLLDCDGLLQMCTMSNQGLVRDYVKSEDGHTIGSPKFFHRISDTEFFVADEHFACALLSGPPDGSNLNWRIQPMRDRHERQYWLSGQVTNECRFCVLEGNEPRFMMVDSIGKMHLIERDPSAPGAWHFKQVANCNYYFDLRLSVPNTAVNECVNIISSSPHDFFTFHKDGAILHWIEDADGNWRKSMIKDSEDDGIVSAHLISSDPPAFMLFGKSAVTFQRISPDGWRAYHERQSAQRKLPPLPSNI